MTGIQICVKNKFPYRTQDVLSQNLCEARWECSFLTTSWEESSVWPNLRTTYACVAFLSWLITSDEKAAHLHAVALLES